PQQHGDDRGQKSVSGMLLESQYATVDCGTAQERETRIEGQKCQCQTPRPTDSRHQSQRTPVQQTVRDPGTKPGEAAEIRSKYILYSAVHDRGRITVHHAKYGH